MIALDVNVLVSALRTDAPDHEAVARWFEQAVDAPEPVGISDAVLTGTARVLTHHRVHATPTPTAVAVAELSRIRAQDGVVTLVPGRRFWGILSALCTDVDATGNLLADAAHAALAMEHDCTFITKDRDFTRFPGLRHRHPLGRAA